MPLPDRAKAEDETTSAFRRAGLIRMRDDARIEQGRGLEGIFVQEVGADQLTLGLGENRMRREGDFHLVGALLEGRQQVAMAALEIIKDVGELVSCGLGIQRQDPLDDMVRAGLVGGIEVARLGRRPERPHDHARGIGPQMENLPVQECDL